MKSCSGGLGRARACLLLPGLYGEFERHRVLDLECAGDVWWLDAEVGHVELRYRRAAERIADDLARCLEGRFPGRPVDRQVADDPEGQLLPIGIGGGRQPLQLLRREGRGRELVRLQAPAPDDLVPLAAV